MSFITVDMIKELITDSVIRKIFSNVRVKSHTEKLVKRVVLDLRDKEAKRGVESVSGLKDELSKMMKTDEDIEMLSMMCDTMVKTINGY